jgi:hypothetical protein
VRRMRVKTTFFVDSSRLTGTLRFYERETDEKKTYHWISSYLLVFTYCHCLKTLCKIDLMVLRWRFRR